MSFYTVGATSFEVEKDGTPLGGSPYADSVTAWQAAHDDAANGDTLHGLIGSHDMTTITHTAAQPATTHPVLTTADFNLFA